MSIVYIKYIKSLISDKTEFEKVDTKKGTVNHEKQIRKLFKIFKVISSK